MMGLILAAVLHSTAWRVEQLRSCRLPSPQDDGALGYQASSLRLLTVKQFHCRLQIKADQVAESAAGCRARQIWRLPMLQQLQAG